MSVETLVSKAMKDVPKAVASGVVDMASGMLLAVKSVDSHPQEVLDLVAGATRELYEGDLVTQIENLFKQVRGVTSSEHYFREIVIISKNLCHFFSRLEKSPEVVMCVVARADTNLGLALSKVRSMSQNEKV